MPGSRPDDTTPTTGPGRGFVAAAALLGLVAVGLVVVLVVSFTRSDTPPTAASPATSAATSTATASSSAAPSSSGTSGEQGRPPGCATTDTDQTVPTSTPTGITWTLANRVAVPSSATAGPALRAEGGVGYCFAHTPLGAVLTVTNYGQGTGTRAEINAATAEHLLVQNQYTAALLAQPSTPSSGAPGQLAGFRVVSYTPDQAVITIAIAGDNPGTYGIGTASLQWDRGDWRAVPQAGPALLVSPGSTTSLADFVPFSGVGR